MLLWLWPMRSIRLCNKIILMIVWIKLSQWRQWLVWGLNCHWICRLRHLILSKILCKRIFSLRLRSHKILSYNPRLLKSLCQKNQFNSQNNCLNNSNLSPNFSLNNLPLWFSSLNLQNQCKSNLNPKKWSNQNLKNKNRFKITFKKCSSLKKGPRVTRWTNS